MYIDVFFYIRDCMNLGKFEGITEIVDRSFGNVGFLVCFGERKEEFGIEMRKKQKLRFYHIGKKLKNKKKKKLIKAGIKKKLIIFLISLFFFSHLKYQDSSKLQ